MMPYLQVEENGSNMLFLNKTLSNKFLIVLVGL